MENPLCRGNRFRMTDETTVNPELTERQQRVIAEIQRIARMLDVRRLSQSDFDKHHQLGCVSTAGYQFGSWNRAVRAAGLEPFDSGQSNRGPKIADDELLDEIVRLHRQLGKPPSEREMARFGQYSPKPYKDRWGSWTAAREAAYQRHSDEPGVVNRP
jgi:hypothetical protein